MHHNTTQGVITMPLTEKRKADRAQMATAVAMLAASLDAHAEIEEMSPREVWINIRARRGLCLTVDFDGQSCQPDIHVVSWHMASDVDTCFADAFGDLNPYHFRKATDIARGFDELCAVLTRGLEMARDGTAFSDERETAHIAEHGAAAAREASFAAWRAELQASKAATN